MSERIIEELKLDLEKAKKETESVRVILETVSTLLAEILHAAGVTNDHGLGASGPQLLLFGEDYLEHLKNNGG
jgi:hypothetical protein